MRLFGQAKKTGAGGNGGAMEVKLSKTVKSRRGNGEVETVFTVAEQSRAGLAAAWEPTLSRTAGGRAAPSPARRREVIAAGGR